jgi:purine-binding chemotaxis protein CheW
MSNTQITEIRQYLTFKLSEEVFGVDVAQVREILDSIKITKVPQTPDFMCGVINLRGSVVPVIDMRLKFGLEKTNATVDTCIIVVEVKFDDENIVLGALVDSVQEVFELDPADIEAAPKIGTKHNTDYIKGMGKRDDRFIIILNIDKIFSSGDLSAVLSSEIPEEEITN